MDEHETVTVSSIFRNIVHCISLILVN